MTKSNIFIGIDAEVTKTEDDNNIFSINLNLLSNTSGDTQNPVMSDLLDKLYLRIRKHLFDGLPTLFGRALTEDAIETPEPNPIEIIGNDNVPLEIIIAKKSFDAIRLIAFSKNLDAEKIAKLLGEIRM